LLIIGRFALEKVSGYLKLVDETHIFTHKRFSCGDPKYFFRKLYDMMSECILRAECGPDI